MELRQKPDFEKVVDRFEAWWRCEIIDRPLVSIGVKREGPAPAPLASHHASLRERWMDVEYRLDCFEASLAGQVFLGEDFPRFVPNLGPELTATLFGCELEFTERTSWSKPVASSCREVLGMQPDFSNVYWTTIRRLTDASLERGEGRWITALTDLHFNGDLVAPLRDPQELAIEMADDIESVAAACAHVTDFVPAIYEDLYDRIAAAGQPSCTWIAAPCRGKMYATSCDFICMISPEMFRRTILPCLVREMKYLDANIYHLDGPGALRHMDDLLAVPELNGVQWVYGAGNGPARRWIDVYKRIQAAGKNVQLLCEDIADAEALMEHLRPEGAWFCLYTSCRRDEAEAFIRRVERWGAGKRA